MERLGYDFWDVEKESGEPVSIQDGKTLRLTMENLEGVKKTVLSACRDIESKGRLTRAFDELPHVMLQEAVNETLSRLREANPKSYGTFLRSLCEWENAGGNRDPELQSYAFERLLENGSSMEELLSSRWSSGALEWMATKGYREFIIRYFGESENGPDDELGPFVKSINVKGMKELFADAKEYWKIRQKQRQSVDPAVRSR